MNKAPAKSIAYTEQSALSIIALLFILRPSVPFFKYPFLIFYSLFIFYFIFRYKSLITSRSIIFLKSLALPLLLSTILFIAFVFSDKMYLSILKELVNIMVLISFFIILNVLIDSKEALTDFSTNFQNQLLYFCVFISLIGLIELFGILPDHAFLSKYHIFSNLLRVTGEFDYNFAVLPLLLGLLVLLRLLGEERSSHQIILLNFLFVLFSAAIFLSGSFRSLIVLTAIYVILYFSKLIYFLRNLLTSRKSKFKYNSILLTNVLLSFTLSLFLLKASGSCKTNMLEFIGSKNTKEVKFNIAAYLYKYVSILDKKTSYAEFHDFLWSPDYDPMDPDSGWGTRIHTDVFPLSGLNAEIVPKGAIGYKMDHKSDADSSDVTYTRIWSSIHLTNNSNNSHDSCYVATIYCYVSDDFDGAYARLYCSKDLSYYDMNQKGRWQQLKIEFQSNNVIPVEFEWAIPRGSDIKKIKGYVIFSFPQFEKIHKLNHISQRIFFNAGLSGLGFKILSSEKKTLIEFDPMKRWIIRCFSEDTIYKAPKSILIADTTKESVLNNRTLRWKFGWQIYKKEYDLKKKLIGGGFTFLNWYGYYFLKDKTKSEYPHNPFLNILLYSGIVGLFLYLFVILKVFNIYTKYRNEYSFFFMSFIIIYFYSFFSGSNPFDPAIMGFFILLPFFIQSIHEKNIVQTQIFEPSDEKSTYYGSQ